MKLPVKLIDRLAGSIAADVLALLLAEARERTYRVTARFIADRQLQITVTVDGPE